MDNKSGLDIRMFPLLPFAALRFKTFTSSATTFRRLSILVNGNSPGGIGRRQFIATSLGAAFAVAPSREFSRFDLFEAGQGGYASYRIPGIVVTKRGVLLAYCEARRTGRGDWDAIDILLRRSTDGGRTWDRQRKIAQVAGTQRNPAAARERSSNPDELTYNNPMAIADRRNGVVHFIFCLEYSRCFYMRSDDDGSTFSQPVEITSAFEGFRKEYDWKVIATGPGHGIQLRNGRLVVPVWLSTSTGSNAHHPSDNAVIYSDDNGRTWKAGGFVGRNSPELVNPSEAALIELADGRVMFNSRSESTQHRRMVSYSRNGATGWTQPAFHEQLLEPICMASMVRLSGKPRRNRILFANPDNLSVEQGVQRPGRSRSRKNLSIKLSYDEGATWPVNKSIETGWSGYSDLAVGPDGTIFCFFESVRPGANLFRECTLTLARLDIEWLTDGKDAWESRKKR